MRAKNLIPWLLLALGAHSSALTEAEKKAGEDLVATMQEEAKAIAEGNDENGNAANLRQIIRQVQAGLAQESSRTLEQTLNNFGGIDLSKKVQDGIATLRKAVNEEKQKKTREQIAELQALLDSTREKITRATEPEELDKIIASLARNRFNNMSDSDGYGSPDPALRSLISELNNARQFATNWQDYLQASITGNTSAATQSLRSLAGQDSTLIPRSQIIARLEFEKKGGDEVAKIIEGVKTLDDMKPAIQKLSKMQGRSSSSENPEAREALQSLSRLEKTYREFNAGLPVNVEVLTMQSSGNDSMKFEFVDLRAKLLLAVLPRCLYLPENIQPAPDENVTAFLDRALKDAGAREDIQAYRRIRDVRQSLMQAGSFSYGDTEELRSYDAGRKQLEAGQYMLAVVSLQTALKSGSSLIPAAKTGEMLARIQKEHPEEYEQGMTEFLTPRARTEPGYSRQSSRDFPPYSQRRYMDGDPRNQPPGTQVVLPVPAKEGTPEKETATPPPPAKDAEKPAPEVKAPVK